MTKNELENLAELNDILDIAVQLTDITYKNELKSLNRGIKKILADYDNLNKRTQKLERKSTKLEIENHRLKERNRIREAYDDAKMGM